MLAPLEVLVMPLLSVRAQVRYVTGHATLYWGEMQDRLFAAPLISATEPRWVKLAWNTPRLRLIACRVALEHEHECCHKRNK